MSPGTSTTSGSVDEAHRLAQADPVRALELVDRILAEPDGAEVDQARALWARGLAERELDQLDDSATTLGHAIDLADDTDPELAAEIRSSLAWLQARRGENDDALRLTTEAAAHLTGAAAGRNQMQRGLILQRLGRHRDALESYELALAGLIRSGDDVAAARLRLNRSVIYVYRGDFPAAIADLETAHSTAETHGQDLLVAACAHNLGFAEGRRGDIPRALRWFEVAEAAFDRLGSDHRKAALYSDRAEVYADGGLIADALAEARRAVDDLRGEGEEAALADALLTLARLADTAGDDGQATATAEAARRMFAAQGRKAWELQARYVETLGRLTGDEAIDLEEVQGLVETLEEQGWETEALRVRVQGARQALERDDRARARHLLDGTTLQRDRADLTSRLAQAEAAYLTATLDGRTSDADKDIRRGLELLDRYRTAVGSVEIRAGMARHGARLVAAAVDSALADGSPWRVLRAVETWRARSMEFPPVRPPDDPQLAEAASEIRTVEAEIRAGRQAGSDTSHLDLRRVRLERVIVQATRKHEGDSSAFSLPPLRKKDLTDQLHERGLVAYFRRHGDLHAVHFDERGWRLTGIGAVTEVERLVDALQFSLRRLADPRASEAALDAHTASLEEAAAALSTLLIEGLDPADGPLTLIPTGLLHRVTWSMLPAMSGRPFSVAPSVRAWMRAVQLDIRLQRLAAMAGPDLAPARREVDQISRIYPDSRRLTGRNATVDRCLQTLAGADVAHLAAHGNFRGDNPLFSSLRLYDGSLTVHDLERLERVPTVFVLPACESAVSDVGADDELLGLAAALLRTGVVSLIAPTTPVPDDATRPFVVTLHRRLRATGSPEVALAEAVAHYRSGSPRERVAAGSFVLLGA